MINLKIDTKGYSQGLFGYTSSAEIKNVGIVGGSVKSGKQVGGLGGRKTIIYEHHFC